MEQQGDDDVLRLVALKHAHVRGRGVCRRRQRRGSQGLEGGRQLGLPRYSIKSNGVLLEDKAAITKRLGRSPDQADAVVIATRDDPRRILLLRPPETISMQVTL